MPTYELINPSDPIHLTATDHTAATAACVLLGNGKYALEPLEGEDAKPVPIMMFGDPEPWFMEHFGQTVDDFLASINANPSTTIAALRSVRLAHGGEATSLNDICTKAQRIADRLQSQVENCSSE